MGILFSKPSPVKSLTEQERAHLVLLGTTAGNPDIVINAVKSGNIFDPKHMEEALARKAEWEQGIALLAPVIERQKRYEAEDEQLRKMGARMDGRPVTTSYAFLEANVEKRGIPGPDWFLRIEADDQHVDMMLGPYEDHLYDALLTATRYVPRFQARLFCPEPVVVLVIPNQ